MIHVWHLYWIIPASASLGAVIMGIIAGGNKETASAVKYVKRR